MRKSSLGALVTAALIGSVPAAAAPDPLEFGVPAIAAGTEPHVFSVGKPVWSITANGKANLALLHIKNSADVSFYTGLVTFRSATTDDKSGSVVMDIVALQPGKVHALICRASISEPKRVFQFQTIVGTPNGDVAGQTKMIEPVLVADGSFKIATYTFSLGNSLTGQVEMKVPASANPVQWSFRNCYLALASF